MSTLTCLRPAFAPRIVSAFPREAAAIPPAVSSTNFFAPPRSFPPPAVPANYFAVLDGTNRIVHVSDTWNSFAPPTLRRRDVLGRTVAWFIADETTRECFRLLLERVRTLDRTARIITRCDLPTRPRALQVTLVPFENGEVEVAWSLFAGPQAEEIAALPRRQFRKGEYLRMCSWCRSVHMPQGWQYLDAAAPALGLLDHDVALPPITHGICPACSAALAAENAQRVALPIAV